MLKLFNFTLPFLIGWKKITSIFVRIIKTGDNDVMFTIYFLLVYLHPAKTYYFNFLSFNLKRNKLPKNQFDINIANDVAIDFANNIPNVADK